MNGPEGRDNWAAVATTVVAGALFFVGGIMIGLGVGLLVLILLVPAVVTVGLFVLS